MDKIKITEISTYPLLPKKDKTNSQAVACPMAIYPEYRSSRNLWRDDFGELIVKIKTDAGVEGIGYTSHGSLIAAMSIELHLKRLLLGENPLSHERLQDILIRSTYHQGRDGYLMHGISALDLALWDIKGKIAGKPVCQLLGGPIHDSLPCYLTGYDTKKVLKENFKGLKLPLHHGPAEGKTGLDKNVKGIADLREKLGSAPDIMLDCWMGLDLPYAIELYRATRGLRVKWLEEPLLPGDIDGYRQLKSEIDSDCLIACGEHETLVRGAMPFFKDRIVDIWQPDVTWVGGITTMQKIASLAAASKVMLIPHLGCSPWAAHFMLAHPESIWAEYNDAHIPRHKGKSIFESDTAINNGRIYPGKTPGFGVEINWEVVEQNLDRRVRLNSDGPT